MSSNTTQPDALPAAGSISPTAYNHPLLHAQAAAKPGCKCGVLRPPRKLHAAVGLWLAFFVAVHFVIGLTAVNPVRYELITGWLHRSPAALPGVVLLLVLLPMLVQAAGGIFLIVKEGVKYDVKRCDRGGNLRYFLQRWSGLAMLAFLLPHIVILRGWAHALVGSTLSSAGLPESGGFGYTLLALHPWSSAAANSAMIGLLLAGVLGTVFHIANGAWSGFVLWKVVSTDRGKAWLNLASLAAGIALALVGSIAWYAFSLRPYLHGSIAALLR